MGTLVFSVFFFTFSCFPSLKAKAILADPTAFAAAVAAAAPTVEETKEEAVAEEKKDESESGSDDDMGFGKLEIDGFSLIMFLFV